MDDVTSKEDTSCGEEGIGKKNAGEWGRAARGR